MPRYDAKRIEAKWQQFWEKNSTFQTGQFVDGKPKLYVLDMFPYPSGDGLHVGHPEGYTATDIVCRYNRMKGKQVLHPMGWDAFGLPAEQHAVKTGIHPRITTSKNIDTFRRQLKMLGFSYDWSREFSTTDPDYFRWTQWIFLQVFDTWYDADFEWTGTDGKKRKGKGRPIAELPIPDDVQTQGTEAIRRYQDKHRLAYQHEAPVNWCPALSTVLSNEEVIDGKSERGGHPVERMPLRQWMLRITSYAERLLDELDMVDWPESIKLLQRNWIGRSEGAEVDFFIGSEDTGDLEAAFEQWKSDRAASGYPAEAGNEVLRVYTTRPDTLYGATYMVMAPEHRFVNRLTTPEQKAAVDAYRKQAAMKSDLDRTDLAKGKTGVFTGSYAVNPVNGQKIPIWIADYVLISYGTGAIMAVPAHDDRDFEFAQEKSIPVKCVVEPPELEQRKGGVSFSPPPGMSADDIKQIMRDKLISQDQAVRARYDEWREGVLNGKAVFTGEGEATNSGDYNGLKTCEFKAKITAELADGGMGRKAVNYRLRDWLFSRQHFWGEPFPIWHEVDESGNLTGLMRADSEDQIPIPLPENFDFKPHGRPDPPLEEAPNEWLYRTDADGTRLKRETNSMPQWAGSCWYYLRFTDPKNDQAFVDPETERQWMPVDLYVGGAEHAVLHLLYARFWHKVLFDREHVSTAEPFQRLVNQGMILGEPIYRGAKNAQDEPVSVDRTDISFEEYYRGMVMKDIHGNYSVELGEDDVDKKGDEFVLKDNRDIKVDVRTFKMSKSRGNVINPDDIVQQYGADSLRMYEMFMGPLEATKPWSMSGVDGVCRFLGRVWRMITDERSDELCLNSAVQDIEPTPDQLRLLHKTIKAVTDDIEKLSFNTAISRMMEFTNELGTNDPRPKSVLEPFVLLLSPFAPHIAEELWELLGHDDTLAYAAWPSYDESLIAQAEIEVPVQVNGKVRSRVVVPADADAKAIEQAAAQDDTVTRHLEGKNVLKVVVVPGRLVNFVVK